jgi:hypothetical protein
MPKEPKSNTFNVSDCCLPEFTKIPTEVIFDPKLSLKAKGMLLLLLSNRKWWDNRVDQIHRFSKENKDAIYSGLRELERAGYLRRLTYVDEKYKRRRGSFWAIAEKPGQFDLKKSIAHLRRLGMLILPFKEVKHGKKKPGTAKS